jgi:hypothetical protein
MQIQFWDVQRGIVELANRAAVDARKESKVLQDLVLAKKRCEKKKQKAEDEARKKASTTNKGSHWEKRRVMLGQKEENRKQEK